MDVQHFAQVNPRIRLLVDCYTVTPADMRELTTAIDSQFRSAERQLFAAEGGAPAGIRKWKKLSPKYAKAKAKKYPGRKIMQRTGEGRKSLTTKGGGHVALFVSRPYNAIYVGTSVRHLAYHIAPTAGTPNPLYNPKLPNRDTLGLRASVYNGFAKIVHSFLVDMKLIPNHKALAAAMAYAKAKYGS